MTDQICSIEGCDSPKHARGWCNKHYLRWWLRGDPQATDDSPRGRNRSAAVDRFWAQVQKTESCWLWTGMVLSNGYGQIKSDRKQSVHRFSWELHRGAIPDGMVVCHKCDVRNCVNPEHLFIGTPADNNRDMREKSRHARGERVCGSRLTSSQVLDIRAADDTYAELGRRYGVSATSIRKIKARKTWAWIK